MTNPSEMLGMILALTVFGLPIGLGLVYWLIGRVFA